MVPNLGGVTKDTDFNKGFTKGIFANIFGEEMGGGQGDPDPLMLYTVCLAGLCGCSTSNNLREIYTKKTSADGLPRT